MSKAVRVFWHSLVELAQILNFMLKAIDNYVAEAIIIDGSFHWQVIFKKSTDLSHLQNKCHIIEWFFRNPKVLRQLLVDFHCPRCNNFAYSRISQAKSLLFEHPTSVSSTHCMFSQLQFLCQLNFVRMKTQIQMQNTP